MNEVKQALADYCRHSNRSPAKALAELAAELMLSDGSDPLHVYGPDFARKIDQAMLEEDSKSCKSS